MNFSYCYKFIYGENTSLCFLHFTDDAGKQKNLFVITVISVIFNTFELFQAAFFLYLWYFTEKLNFVANKTSRQ
jgi:hypothetical protein